MEYRKLPHGDELISVLGIGTGSLADNTDAEITAIIKKAMDHGINFFDLCCGARNIYKPFGEAIRGKREKVYLQVHFGAVYNENGEYGWSRNLSKIKETFESIMNDLGTDYVDFGFLHCVDEEKDFKVLKDNGILEYMLDLQDRGVIRHLGFSSHDPKVASIILDTGLVDMFMFSTNPVFDYDLSKDDLEVPTGHTSDRKELFIRSQKEGVGISIMKPFHAGKLLDAKKSPFKVSLTKNQCLQYALDRPGVLTTVPGIRNMQDLEELFSFIDSTPDDNDYSAIASIGLDSVKGSCIYCRHCQPCPIGIDIGLVNKYYDLARIGDKLALSHYYKLEVNASNCISCGHCDARCPFKVKQSERMKEIDKYFKEKQEV